tara:strand:+ start:484 stop:702 length:219 start_codon:yes stop_codon:yes gene_type:complete
MIDFNTSQLSWIVVGALGIGGTGYMTMNDNVKNIDKKVEVTHSKVEDTNARIVELQRQLTRMEDKLDKRGSR